MSLFTKDYGDGVVVTIEPYSNGRFCARCDAFQLNTMLDSIEEVAEFDKETLAALARKKTEIDKSTADLAALGFFA